MAGLSLIVCGGRDFDDHEKVWKTLDRINDIKSISMIIHGGCKGADMIAENWCWNNAVHSAICQPIWDRHGPKAGPLRNKAMLLLKPDGLVAFTGGRGTRSMIDLAKGEGVTVMEIK